jgi:hypothetical protein
MRTHSLLAGHRTRTPDSLSPGTGRCPPLTVVSRSSSRPCVSSPSSSQLRAPHLVFVSFFTLLVQHDVRPAVSAPPSPPPLPPSFRLASLGPETKVPHGVSLSRTLELSNSLSNSLYVCSRNSEVSRSLSPYTSLSLSFSLLPCSQRFNHIPPTASEEDASLYRPSHPFLLGTDAQGSDPFSTADGVCVYV